MSVQIQPASLGTVSHGTLKPEDLLSAFAAELLWQLQRNGHFFCRPENFPLRDRLNALHGEALDAYAEDGETLSDAENAGELIEEITNELTWHFAGPYRFFGTNKGDGSDFGFWPDMEAIRALPYAIGREEGEDYKVVSDHGNIEIYGGDGRSLFGIV